jgi:hypothetical protein
VIGLGTQDSLDEAEEFVGRFDPTFTMLWDETFDSWVELGVTGQPAAVLFDGDGKVLKAWRGRIPESEALRLARGA